MNDRYKKTKKRMFIVLGIFALIIIPTYTIIFAMAADNIFDFSLSFIGNSLGKKKQLIIWGISLAIFFFIFLGYLFKLTNMKNKRINRLLIGSCFLLVLTVFTPFLPEIYPTLAEFHNMFAVGSVLLTLVTLYAYVFTLKDIDTPLYRKTLLAINIVTLLNAIVYFLVGMSSAIEIAFVILVCGFLFLTLFRVYRSEKINVEGRIKEYTEQRELDKQNKKQSN